MEDYRRFSREVDQRTWKEEVIGKMPGIRNFRVYEVVGGNPRPPYDIIEDIEVDNVEAFERLDKSPVADRLRPEWKKVADETSVFLAYARQITPV